MRLRYIDAKTLYILTNTYHLIYNIGVKYSVRMYSVDTIFWQYLAAMLGVGGRLITLRRLPFTVTSGLNVYFSFTIPDEELN